MVRWPQQRLPPLLTAKCSSTRSFVKESMMSLITCAAHITLHAWARTGGLRGQFLNMSTVN